MLAHKEVPVPSALGETGIEADLYDRSCRLVIAPPPLSLPEPAFPQRPEKCGDVAPNPRSVPRDGRAYRTRVTPFMVRRAMRGWLYPYLRSRVSLGDFHPIVAYLFTEWKCNLDCHYCWAFDNRVKGMTEYTARRAIDWLRLATRHGVPRPGGDCPTFR